MDLIETNFSSSGRHPWELSRIATVKALLNANLKQSTNLRFLDFGSGDAFVAAKLVDGYDGATATCIDNHYTEEITKRISDSYGDERLSFYSAAEDLEGSEPFDVVTMLDVLEHIEQPVLALRELLLHAKISKTTLFIISVPAFNSLFTHHDTLLEHYTRYNQQTIAQVLEDAGLLVKKSGYFNSCLLPIRAIEKLNEKYCGKKKADTDISWNRSSFFTKVITNFLNADAITNLLLNEAGIKIPGLSCYAIATLP